MAAAPKKDPGSFRDPSGFIYRVGDTVLRQVNAPYLATYQQLTKSGLYKELIDAGLLVDHKELSKPTREGVTLQPEQIPFVSYPHEWCFSQLKDAALLTLQLQKACIAKGFSLKDASAYNIQFLKGKPVFIDTLSFEPYNEGQPWIAYRQFCQHFLAPLVLMAKVDINLGRLSEIYIDGIPLELASHLLPKRTKLNFGILPHIHLHAKSQAKHGNQHEQKAARGSLSKMALMAMIDSLESTVSKLKPLHQQTEWEHYYTFTNYSEGAEHGKRDSIRKLIRAIKPKTVLDLGANTGEYSYLAAHEGIPTIAADIDPFAIEHCYTDAKKNGEQDILPLVIDLTNPSPSIGWGNEERPSFFQRQTPDLAMALALIHHLAISNNLPLDRIARFLSTVAPQLIIEFVPKEDSQVKKLLATREDIFPNYTAAGFEEAFKEYFTVVQRVPVKGSKRTLYHMKRSTK